VSKFVPDDHANSAVIHRIIHVLLEIRRLQNAGGKVDRFNCEL
jgi:hypothetical protein